MQVLDKAVVKKHAVVAPGAVVTPGKVVPTGQVRHRPRRLCRRVQHPMGDSNSVVLCLKLIRREESVALS